SRLRVSELLQSALTSSENGSTLSPLTFRSSSSSRRASRLHHISILLLLPFDAFFWLGYTPIVPFLRLTRFFYALKSAHETLVALEQSQAAPFSLCRLARVLSFTLLFTHCVASALYFFTSIDSASHYRTAPWLISAENGPVSSYTRAVYWSFISFTTAGHKNVVSKEISLPSSDWEAVVALAVALVVTFAFMYMNSNFTSLMIRLNKKLENYRAMLARVDAYLQRNKVSKDICKRVRRHFSRTSTTSNDSEVLSALPPSLQREVLADIHMHTLAAAPTFAALETASLAHVCAVVRTVTYLPDDIICKQDDVVTEMYFLEEGWIMRSVELEPPAADKAIDAVNISGCFSGPVSLRAVPFICLKSPVLSRLFELVLVVLLFEHTTSLAGVEKSDAHRRDNHQLPGSPQKQLHRPQKAEQCVLEQLRRQKDPEMRALAAALSAGTNDASLQANFMRAAAEGRVDVLQEMESKGSKINVCKVDFEGRSALHIAATANHTPVVEFLLARRANTNLRDHQGRTPLANAVAKGHAPVIAVLRSAGAELGWDPFYAASKLCDCVRDGHMTKLKQLLTCGADINAADYDKRTCLHLAASEGSLRTVELLLRLRADVNVTDRWGGTPLRDTIREGHFAVAEEIYAAGGRLLLCTADASTQLCELARRGFAERLELLLKCGCDVNAADYDTRTCLHLAASEGNNAVLRVLISMKADVNAKDRFGHTPLLDAVKSGHMRAAALLREMGGELCQTEAQISQDLCELARMGSIEHLRVLLSCGVEINAADYDKRTCLHLAASEGNVSVVKMLIDHSAAINPLDRWGSTPLSDAVKGSHEHVARLLYSHGGRLSTNELTLGNHLCTSAFLGELESVETLVQCGVCPAATNYNGRSALHEAVAGGHGGVVRLLLALGCPPELNDRLGKSAYEEALEVGNPWIANILKR
ncbi:MAG: hypothetical protein SGPRY_006961, partial [Prymnesium sp.]